MKRTIVQKIKGNRILIAVTHSSLPHRIFLLCLAALTMLAAPALFAQGSPVELQLQLGPKYQFVAYGDTRFTDPTDTNASNPPVRRELVRAIAAVHPAFISIGGDISYKANSDDWKVWDEETAIWREQKIPIFPALGNHDLKGDEKTALANYFQRFPDIQNNRFYSVRSPGMLMLVLDSSLDEKSGPQGTWLASKLDDIPADVNFVFLVFHHPPYTSSSDLKHFGGGHSARGTEKELGKMLEERQQKTRARFVVFSGHVHNYERHEHGGVTYFVTGGGGAHPYAIDRKPDDLFQSNAVNYHYLLAEVDGNTLKVTMNRLEMNPTYSQPDSVQIVAPPVAATAPAAAPAK